MSLQPEAWDDLEKAVEAGEGISPTKREKTITTYMAHCSAWTNANKILVGHREELLKPIEDWWQRYQAVLDEGPMNDLGRILAQLREP